MTTDDSGARRTAGTEAPECGAIARTSDGSDVGVVITVLGDYIQVEDDSDGRLWLSRDDIAGGDGDTCRLDFPLSDLKARQVTPPDNYQQSQYLRELSDEERQQRKIMLRQLAEQRAESYEAGEALETEGTRGEPVEEELERLEESDPNSDPPTWRQ